MFYTLTQEKDIAVIYDTDENLVFLEIGVTKDQKVYSHDYTQLELVDILRRLADSLEFA